MQSYDYADRLVSLSQTVDGQTTNYTLDLNAGLTQVLSDGTSEYVYGAGRIAQINATTEYFLGDALGSVRQLTSSSGQVTLAKSFDPYGTVTASNGTSQSMYGFIAEQTDANGLVYLRARYYNPVDGRFMSRDAWNGDVNRPMSMNRWGYVEGNPVNYTDSSGKKRIRPYDNSDLNECVSSQQLQSVDTSVKYDVCKMIPELESAGFYEDLPDENHITDGYRDPKLAHRISTAYHIIHDFISVDDLEKTPVDLDMTTWYRDEWKYLFPDCQSIVIDWLRDLRIKQNASDQIPPEYYNSKYYVWVGIFRIKSSAYALEGYLPGDPRRLPNSDNPPISKHVLRVAVDVGNGLINPNLKWSQGIDDIARMYNLIRPYRQLPIAYADVKIDEWWHFERP